MVFTRSTGALAALLLSAAVAAGEAPPMSVAVAESERFEAVGRITPEGMSWYVDHADSNAPVLNAELELEFGGKSVKAGFRPERGDYWVADEKWLQPLRRPGEYALALTLIAGSDSDLLSGDLHVEAPDEAAPGAMALPPAGWLALALGLGGLVAWRLRRQTQGGVR